MKKVNFQKGIYILPSLFTTASMFAAFYSIIQSISGNYRMAAAALFVSGFCDLTDGRLARLTKTQSDFGAEYDSLVDLAAFGLAPAILIYTWGVSSYKPLGWLCGFLYFACTALRLARFNVQVDSVEKNRFQGLPSPPAAGVLASYVLFAQEYLTKFPHTNLIALILMPVLGFLMVSNIRYRSFKEYGVKKSHSLYMLIGAAVVIGAIAVKPEAFLFSAATIYAISGPIREVFFFRRGAEKKSVKVQTVVKRFSIVDGPEKRAGDRHG